MFLISSISKLNAGLMSPGGVWVTGWVTTSQIEQVLEFKMGRLQVLHHRSTNFPNLTAGITTLLFLIK
jgi:hypothetical protein